MALAHFQLKWKPIFLYPTIHFSSGEVPSICCSSSSSDTLKHPVWAHQSESFPTPAPVRLFSLWEAWGGSSVLCVCPVVSTRRSFSEAGGRRHGDSWQLFASSRGPTQQHRGGQRYFQAKGGCGMSAWLSFALWSRWIVHFPLLSSSEPQRAEAEECLREDPWNLSPAEEEEPDCRSRPQL